MKHIAIDSGGMESQVCVRDSDGAIQLERKHKTRDVDLFLGGREKSRVIASSRCSPGYAGWRQPGGASARAGAPPATATVDRDRRPPTLALPRKRGRG